jgi:hypothetical protein
MSQRKSREPASRSPRSRGRKGAAQPRTAAAVARKFGNDPAMVLAWIMYNENAPVPQRMRAAKKLVDLGHGKARRSTEMLRPPTPQEHNFTLEDFQAEIKRRGFDHIINLIPNDRKDRPTKPRRD